MMAVDVKAQWHKLTQRDRRQVLVNEAAIAYAHPLVIDGVTFHEIGFIGGGKVVVEQDPEDFLGPLTKTLRPGAGGR